MSTKPCAPPCMLCTDESLTTDASTNTTYLSASRPSTPRSAGSHNSFSRKSHGKIVIRSLWSQLAAVRCWERWKDFRHQIRILRRSKEKFQNANLGLLQVVIPKYLAYLGMQD